LLKTSIRHQGSWVSRNADYAGSPKNKASSVLPASARLVVRGRLLRGHRQSGGTAPPAASVVLSDSGAGMFASSANCHGLATAGGGVVVVRNLVGPPRFFRLRPGNWPVGGGNKGGGRVAAGRRNGAGAGDIFQHRRRGRGSCLFAAVNREWLADDLWLRHDVRVTGMAWALAGWALGAGCSLSDGPLASGGSQKAEGCAHILDGASSGSLGAGPSA